MFLKSLTISSGDKIIREVRFRKGINLIVDKTPSADDNRLTGNNVGKTTVLKLIDFCLGDEAKIVYSDPESKNNEYKLVKNFLTDREILLTLILRNDLANEDSAEIKIEKNFLQGKRKIQKINDEKLTKDEFELKLSELIIPEHNAEKPRFRQIISHNIRYKDENINNTLRTLNKFTTDSEYEALYLFLLGCEFKGGKLKEGILEKIRQEEVYKKRLEKQQTKTAYEAALTLLNAEIEDLDRKKSNLNLNENFEGDLNELKIIKYEINKITSEINKREIRRDLIREAEINLNSKRFDVDLKQLKLIYQQATDKIDNLQKTFDDLVSYHNQMLIEKVKFIAKELPSLEKSIEDKQIYLHDKLEKEKELTFKITKSDSFEDLEKLIGELNEKFSKKGEYEVIIKQVEEAEENSRKYYQELSEIDKELFSEDFKNIVKRQVDKFNKYFAAISAQLYGEQYALTYDIVTNKRKQRVYKFKIFATNFSSGKKQGEISCFDIAYTLFADAENISCLHFLLNDKKELMHDNQLVKIAEFVNKNNIQFVASILQDKLPQELNNRNYFVLELSQQDKLFRIENN